MASKSKRTKIIRKHKKARSGAKSKAARRNHGTTKTPKELFAD